ncbi:MAG: cytochrome C oxidase subunit IV family protein [Actinomycetota bacterium]|nr:cytochrome C oxidase subunit IV family protein [Actinomycetota bacterium]
MTAHQTDEPTSGTAAATSVAVDDPAHDDVSHHPSDWTYIKIALVLAAITALEVFTYFESVVDWGPFLIPSLIVMMVVKFFLVGAFFMHLKFDNPLLRNVFIFGLVLAVAVYVATLLAFEFFVDV